MGLKILNAIKATASSAQFIINHPLNRGRKLNAIRRWFCWQIASRLAPGPIAVPFVNNSRLLVSPGMTGATGNIYCGLHEFESMAFVLHILRRDDLFLDVGANMGTYSILAASVEARCFAFEPVPATYQHLLENIKLNNFQDSIETHNIALSDTKGHLKMTKVFGAENYVVPKIGKINREETVEVEADTLDNIASNLAPLVIKIDVEGYEEQVTNGATRVLHNDSLIAVILETNESGKKYGHQQSELHKKMLNYDFKAFKYSPFDRNIIPLNSTDFPNTLYVRNYETVRERLVSASPFQVMERII